MNSDKQKAVNMIDEMLFIIERQQKRPPRPDRAFVRATLEEEEADFEVNSWMTFRLNSLKELLSPGTGFKRQSAEHIDRHSEFLKKVGELSPQLIRKQATDLLDEMLAEAARTDEMHKKNMIRKMQGEKAIGESWLIFTLRNLRKLVFNAFIEESPK